MARSLFSQSWHSVAELRPRLLPGARVHRHVYRGQPWYVLQDQGGGRYHRCSAGAYALIARMDGRTPVQALWDEACRGAGDGMPTQNDVVELLVQLHAADLLQTDMTPDAAALFERYRKRRDQTWKQWLMNPMALKLPLVDPDAFLERWAARLAWLAGPAGAALWLAAVVPALVLAAQHWSELGGNLSDQILSAKNLLVMALVFPLVKAAHELGHGFATKIWGGEVHEMGLMFLVFAPVPYVEASAASAFPSKRRRAVVGAAGMLVEVFLAAAALWVWLAVEPGLVRAVAFNVMLIAGVSTLVVNGNPLLRYDAYYILADLIEMPNLAQRAQRYVSYLCDRWLFGAREAEAPAESPAEKRWLVFYAIASWCYRVFITVSIILFIAGQFFIFGVLVAAWGALALFGLPLWKAARHVLQSPTLHRRRSRAIRTAAGLAAGLAILLCAVPLPMRTQAQGVVWLPDQALLRAGGSGSFERWLVEPGTRVARGTPVLALEDPLLRAELAVAQAKLDETAARYRVDQFADPVKAQIELQQLEQDRRVLERAAERYARLVVRADADGVLVAPRPQDMAGQYFKQGELLGYVLDRSQFIARVVVQQDDIDLVRTRLRGAELRLADAPAQAHRAAVIREMPGGVDELPSAALGPHGGGAIPVDPRDANGVKTLERVFVFDLQLPAEAAPKAFGERVHVRFDHGGEPLAAQGYRRVRQLFLSRFNV
jgi:putative peptide zinc metalloprotease protein